MTASKPFQHEPQSKLGHSAVIYVRVSTDGQEDNTSLETQEAACRRHAQERGYSVQAIYKDVHSGYDLWERPQVRLMLETIRSRQTGAVICYALDRLSRKQTHTAILVDECERAGVALHFVTEEFEQSAVGNFIRSAKAFAAELEREKIRERTLRGKLARLQSGRLLPGPRPPYGYQWRDAGHSALIPNDNTAPVVRRIFAEVMAGRSLRALARQLNTEGVPTPHGGVQWNHSTLRAICTNPRYSGIAEANRVQAVKVVGRKSPRQIIRPEQERVALPQGTIPPLIDEATFAATQERIARNRIDAPRNIRDPQAYLLRAGFVVCGQCGRATTATWQKMPRTGEKIPIYRVAKNSEEHRGCAGAAVTASILDRAVWSRVTQLLTDPTLIAEELARLRQEDPTEADLASVDRQRDTVGRKLANLTKRLAVVEDEMVGDLLLAEISTLTKQRRQLEDEREAIMDRRVGWEEAQHDLAVLEKWVATVATNLEATTYEQKRTILALLNVRVRLFPADQQPRWIIEARIDPKLRVGQVADTSSGRSSRRSGGTPRTPPARSPGPSPGWRCRAGGCSAARRR